MVSSLHGIVLLLLPVATAAVGVRFWRRPGFARLGLAAALGLLLAFVGATFAGGWRVTGAPFSQWVIPALCAASVALCVSHRGVAVGAFALVAAAMWFLLLSHAELANRLDYTSNIKLYLFLDEWRRDVRTKTARRLERAAVRVDDRSYPAGWLVQRVPAAAMSRTLRAIRQQACHRAVVTAEWHTWVSGPHHIDMSHIDLWYPGGPFGSSARDIEWRERPQTGASP